MAKFWVCGEREPQRRIFQVSLWIWTLSLHIQLRIVLTPIEKLNGTRHFEIKYTFIFN